VSEQAVDIRSTLAILRRNAWVLAGVALIGIAAGAGWTYLRPPLYTSRSLVLLPVAATPDAGTGGGQDAATQAQVAASRAVLRAAGRSLTPQASARQLARAVHVSAPTNNVVQIKASATTAGRAQDIAYAVAQADVDYLTRAASSLSAEQRAALDNRQSTLRATLLRVNDELSAAHARIAGEGPNTAQGRSDATVAAQLTAQQSDLALQIDQIKAQKGTSNPDTGATLVENATPAQRPNLLGSYALRSLAGFAVVTGVVALLLVIFGRRGRRLRSRDEIADALGSAVIASLRSQTPRSVAGWSALLESYAPNTVDAWALRQGLRHMLGRKVALGPRPPAAGDSKRKSVTVVIMALADDPRGLALGPQVASYAAALGVSTRLVAAQGHPSAASLWAACSGVYENSTVRDGLTVGTTAGRRRVDLTVVLVVVDRQDIQLTDLPSASRMFLAVSAGAATADDLARAAVTADDAGAPIQGILVADPDDLDRTTGRLLQAERSQQIPLPARLTGAPVVPSGATVSGLRSRRPR
jgi:hypothetical protein